MHSLSQRWLKWHFSLWVLFFLALIGLSCFRGAYLYFLGPEISNLPLGDLGMAFWVGLRFDLKHLAIFFGSLLLLSLVFYRASSSWWKLFKYFSIAYLTFFILLVNLLGIVNYYYFSFYQSPINALIFGLNDDDTGAILATLWYDFPVVKIVLFLVALSGLQVYLAFNFKTKITWQLKKPVFITLMVFSVFTSLFLSRGSLGTFPLREMHMDVSSNTFVNQLVASGVHALYLANKERKETDIGTDPNQRLSLFGFSEWQNAASTCLAKPIATYSDLRQQLPFNPSVAENQPHVVLAIMEGWGRHLMDFDQPLNNDLLGNLRPWIEGKADYFPQALSSQNGTHPSLEAILIDTPITPLTQSIYGYLGYDTSRVLPYKKAGYKTVFITAGQGSWRKIQEALLLQGFDEVHDEKEIMKAYPHATKYTWGVDDEWLFKYALDTLNAANERNEKLMLVLLSITNHGPHRIPSHYQPYALDQSKLNAASFVNKELGKEVLQTYQYANNALGDFMQGLDDSALLPNTLFAATGDHQTRSIFNYPDNSELPLKYGVPLLFYIPEKYQLSSASVDKNIWAAHDDIFPTLWEHSLSETEVPLTGGNNIYTLIPETSSALSFIDAGGGAGIAISDYGAITNFSQPKYYQWSSDLKKLELLDQPTPELEKLMQQERACFALKDWRIRYQALGN